MAADRLTTMEGIQMRQDVEFDAEGTTLRGWFYQPDTATVPVPTVVMAHGYSGVKEQDLDRYAEVFAAAGLGVLVYDHRNFGASDGEPRQEIDPVSQARDYRHAITFTRTLPEVDPERIGVWGTSYSGGHALVAAALDRRVKCAVAQVPTIDGYATVQRLIRPDFAPAVQANYDDDRKARFRGEPPAIVPVVARNPLAPCALPGREAWAFFDDTDKVAPAWRNEVTLRSLEFVSEYDPGAYAARVSPTPLLMIVATHDTLTPTDLALAAYERALPPKRLLLLPGGHFDPYGEQFVASSGAARDWFVEHLGPSAPFARTSSPETQRKPVINAAKRLLA